jgi:hypothetical protein
LRLRRVHIFHTDFAWGLHGGVDVKWSGVVFVFWSCIDGIVVNVKVSRVLEPFSPMGIYSTDTNQPPNGEICMDKSQLLSNNPARQKYRYTSVPSRRLIFTSFQALVSWMAPYSSWAPQTVVCRRHESISPSPNSWDSNTSSSTSTNATPPTRK